MGWILATPDYIGYPDSDVSLGWKIAAVAFLVAFFAGWLWFWGMAGAASVRGVRRAGTKAYTAEFSRNRQVALARDGRRCRMCGRPGTASEPLHVHHQIPRARGGSNAPSNLITLCPYHHHLMHRR